MKISNFKFQILRFFLVVLLFLEMTAGAYAQTSIPLTVMPARNFIEVDPGEKFVLTVNFYNQSEEPLNGFFQAADFIVDNNQRTPRLIENIEEAPSKYAASSWLSFLYDRATLPAHDKVSLQTTINVPQDARPGGRYAAVFFQTEANQEAGIATNVRIASLLYIKVKGAITEKALVARFLVPVFFEYGPIIATTDILNRGDYHITPRATITLTDVFGDGVDQKVLKQKNIFPDGLVTYETELGKKLMVGRYKVNLSGSYGETGQALTATTYVWVFPWRIGLAVLLALIIVILTVSNFYNNFVKKETSFEEEIQKKRIEKLKEQHRRRW